MAQAYEHAHELYPDCDSWCLAWPRRLGWVVEHVQQHMPDVLCLQEVDHWDQLRATLQPFGCVYVRSRVLRSARAPKPGPGLLVPFWAFWFWGWRGGARAG